MEAAGQRRARTPPAGWREVGATAYQKSGRKVDQQHVKNGPGDQLGFFQGVLESEQHRDLGKITRWARSRPTNFSVNAAARAPVSQPSRGTA